MQLISQFFSPTESYLFYQLPDSEQIVADYWDQTSNSSLIPVSIDGVRSHVPSSLENEAERIRWLTQNFHFSPYVYNSKVAFQLIPPDQKEWKVARERDFNGVEKGKKISEDLLCFWTDYHLYLWDWKKDQSWCYCYTTKNLPPEIILLSDKCALLFKPRSQLDRWDLQSHQTSTVENIDGSNLLKILPLSNDQFAFGYSDGKIEVRNQSLEIISGCALKDWEGIQLVSLINLTSNRLIVECKDNKSTSLICIELNEKKNTVLAQDLPLGSESILEPLSDHQFIWSLKKSIKIYVANTLSNEVVILQPGYIRYQTGYQIERVLPQGYAIIGRITIGKWDKKTMDYYVYNAREESIKPLEHFGEVYLYASTFLIVENETLIVAYEKETRIWDLKTGKLKSYHKSPHIYGYTGFLKLDDGSIASGSSDHHLHIYDSNSISFFDKDYGVNVRRLFSLKEGGIVVLSSKMEEFVVLSSKVEVLLPERKSLDNNTVSMDLGERFSSYKYRGLRYKAEKNVEGEYRLYLTAFSDAIQQRLFSKAHKFFAKAIRLKPDEELPFHLYANQIRDQKERRFLLRQEILFQQRKGNQTVAEELAQQLPSHAYKKSCHIGEGNYTFTEDLINKHVLTYPGLASSIIATEIDEACYVRNAERIEKLKKKGVQVRFDIDGRKIHEKFKGERFEKIRWNGPYLENTSASETRLKGDIAQFFLSSSCLQLAGDRVYMALAQEEGYKEKRQIDSYGIVPAATLAGYRLVATRLFKERYPHYKHAMTGRPDEYHHRSREFVFEKVDTMTLMDATKDQPSIPVLANRLKNPSQKDYRITHPYEESPNYYYSYSTDEDSTDYETDGE